MNCIALQVLFRRGTHPQGSQVPTHWRRRMCQQSPVGRGRFDQGSVSCLKLQGTVVRWFRVQFASHFQRVKALGGSTVHAKTWPWKQSDNRDERAVIVPENHVWLSSDAAPSGYCDSTYFGPLPVTEVIGVVKAVVWPPNRFEMKHVTLIVNTCAPDHATFKCNMLICQVRCLHQRRRMTRLCYFRRT